MCVSPGDLTFEPALGPHAVAVQKDAPRFGPGAYPLTLAGHYSHAYTGNVFIFLYNPKSVLSDGIALSELPRYLGTPTGLELLNSENCLVTFLPKGCTLYVPWGWYAQPLYYSTLNKDKPKDPWIYLLHVPVIDTALAKEVDVNVLRAGNQLIMKHLVSLASKQMWKERKDAWEKFWTELGL